MLDRERELDRHLGTARAVRTRAEQTAQELAGASIDQQTRSLRALTDQLVTFLVPMLEAEDKVLCSLLRAESQDGLRSDYRNLRGLAERLSVLSEHAEATRRRALDLKPVTRAVSDTMTALDSLERHLRDAFSVLDEALSSFERGELETALRAASAAAREQTLLVVQPAIPTRASTVFRHRPDLDSARVITVAALDRES